MPDDLIPSPPDPEKCPPSDRPEPAHSDADADWAFQPPCNLTETQLRAIELTVVGHSDTQIAEMVCVDRKTLWRWKMLNDEYRYVLASARAQLHAAGSDRCQNLLFRATAVLARFLDDPSDKNRMRAAQILLQTAARFRFAPEKLNPPAGIDDWPAPQLPPKVG
jgi:hypothetical protein